MTGLVYAAEPAQGGGLLDRMAEAIGFLRDFWWQFLAAGLGCAGLAALGCGKSGTSGPPDVPRPRLNLTPDQEALVKGQNEFAFELYGREPVLGPIGRQ